MAARRSAAVARQGSTTARGDRKTTSHEALESHRANLDRVIHDRTRLAIMSALMINERLSFTELRTMIDTTDGNLSVHARKLEAAGYLRCDKSFVKRIPRSDFSLTTTGRRALGKYLDHMEALIRATRRST